MPDPLEVLRLPSRPIAPDPTFAGRLRARLEAALAPVPPDPDALPPISLRPQEDAMSDTRTTSTQAVTPYLAVADAAAALEWYRDVLGALETTRFVGDDGTIGHAEVVIGGSTLMLSDEWPDGGVRGPAHYGGTTVTLHLEVVDVDHTFSLATEAGGEVERPPADQFHGSRTAVIRDPFGHRWMLSQPIAPDRADAASGDGAADQGFEVTGRPPIEPGYITMQTRDLARARAFYGSLFSWAVEAGSQEGGGHIANTRFPMGFVEVDGAAADGPVSVYFRVDDIERYATRITELGGEVLARTEYPSGGNAECRDDQGFRFDLFRPAPGY